MTYERYLIVHRCCDEATRGDSAAFVPVLASVLDRMGCPRAEIGLRMGLPLSRVRDYLTGPIDTSARTVAEGLIAEQP
jgi:hypothetical protein